MDNQTATTGTIDWLKAHQEQQKTVPVHTQTCPNCGYCPHCGRGGYHTRPWQPYPAYPWISW